VILKGPGFNCSATVKDCEGHWLIVGMEKVYAVQQLARDYSALV